MDGGKAEADGGNDRWALAAQLTQAQPRLRRDWLKGAGASLTRSGTGAGPLEDRGLAPLVGGMPAE